ncbi:MAG: sensor domain-containing protein [Gordonia sp. (in: high G+C Gram-positive bacteria)]|uniref:hypothetical protein n=1 Tax=Gordonia sp. (in: high G+C Gram-positive bacteria) TaxID=84139 RepID=UPI0039E5CFEA
MTRLFPALAAVAVLATGCGASAHHRVAPAAQLLNQAELDAILAQSDIRTSHSDAFARVSHTPTACAPTVYYCRPLFLPTEAAFPRGYHRYTEVYHSTGPNNAGVAQAVIRYGSSVDARAAFDRIVTDLLTTRDRHLSGQFREGDRAAWLWLTDGPHIPIGPFQTASAIRLAGDTVATATLRAPDTRAVLEIVGRIPVAQ